MQSAIANQTEVCGGSDRQAGIEERRVFHCMPCKPLGSELQHVVEYMLEFKEEKRIKLLRNVIWG